MEEERLVPMEIQPEMIIIPKSEYDLLIEIKNKFLEETK